MITMSPMMRTPGFGYNDIFNPVKPVYKAETEAANAYVRLKKELGENHPDVIAAKVKLEEVRAAADAEQTSSNNPAG